ncbi:synaptonemal complex central element protein 2 isoform X2 [Cynoglossus semilaevis]|uniref:synaptonemal complex central element protein 2 isoform X2 n=1 Tax=Cynoglossus semilaevis TaxID=244447 RepID=UPI00049660A2|nr:uncharacterized protein LOC103384208 isoform X2 [Cynoglossus semilaevis]
MTEENHPNPQSCDNRRENSQQEADHDSGWSDDSTSSLDSITRRMEELVENINRRRTSDQKLMESFHRNLTKKVSDANQQMKDQMFIVYEDNNRKMQAKLQEISDVLDNCTKLKNELLEASGALCMLQEGLDGQRDTYLKNHKK